MNLSSVLAVAVDPEFLAGVDARIVAVPDADAARAAIASDPPDVIVLDERAIALVARAQAEGLPVVVLAGSRDGLVDALGLGASDGVVAPHDPGEIVARVNAALRSRGAQDALVDANARLASLALTDVLTGLPNRRDCELQLEREIARSARNGQDLGLIKLELDRFQTINDTHGPEIGDALLAEVAQRLLAVARTGDVQARWGGDEFVVLATGTDRSGTLSAGERLRAAVADARVQIDAEREVSITASVGWSCWKQGDQASELLDRADRALLEAKAAGRDTIRPSAVEG